MRHAWLAASLSTLLTLGACAASLAAPSPDAATFDRIADIEWQWTGTRTRDGVTVADAPARYTLRFDAAGRVAVRADCNRGSASVAAAGGQRLSIARPAMTKRRCEHSQDVVFLQQLGDVDRWSLDGDDLLLGLRGDGGTMRFARAAR